MESNWTELREERWTSIHWEQQISGKEIEFGRQSAENHWVGLIRMTKNRDKSVKGRRL